MEAPGPYGREHPGPPYMAKRARLLWTDRDRPPEVGPYATLRWHAGRWRPRLTAAGQQLVEDHLAQFPRPARVLRARHPGDYLFARDRGLSDDEIDQIARSALCTAAVHFRPDRESSFRSYATLWIRTEVRMACRFRAGEHEAGVVEGPAVDRALSPPVEEEPDDDLRRIVTSSLRCLTRKQREAVKLKFGFAGGRERSTVEVAERIKLSREGARHALQMALARLRSRTDLQALIS